MFKEGENVFRLLSGVLYSLYKRFIYIFPKYSDSRARCNSFRVVKKNKRRIKFHMSNPPTCPITFFRHTCERPAPERIGKNYFSFRRYKTKYKKLKTVRTKCFSSFIVEYALRLLPPSSRWIFRVNSAYR